MCTIYVPILHDLICLFHPNHNMDRTLASTTIPSEKSNLCPSLLATLTRVKELRKDLKIIHKE
jgi:hypothetical protein